MAQVGSARAPSLTQSAQTLAQLAADAAAGVLRVPVTAAYPLEQVDEAFAAFGAGTLGKVAITCA